MGRRQRDERQHQQHQQGQQDRQDRQGQQERRERHTRPAGEGVSDEEMSREVAHQTPSDRKAEDVFRRESGGASSDTEAAKSDADELPR